MIQCYIFPAFFKTCTHHLTAIILNMDTDSVEVNGLTSVANRLFLPLESDWIWM